MEEIELYTIMHKVESILEKILSEITENNDKKIQILYHLIMDLLSGMLDKTLKQNPEIHSSEESIKFISDFIIEVLSSGINTKDYYRDYEGVCSDMTKDEIDELV